MFTTNKIREKKTFSQLIRHDFDLMRSHLLSVQSLLILHSVCKKEAPKKAENNLIKITEKTIEFFFLQRIKNTDSKSACFRMTHVKT